MDLLLKLPILLFSVIVHEYAHGLTAYKLGDDTAYYSGRLTFNPIAHIDIVGTIVVPLICYASGSPIFGWAKPVPVNPYGLRNPHKDIMKVSLAGPLSNVGLAFVCAILFKLVLVIPIFGGFITGALLKTFQFAVIINLVLACFNLIPVIPLDGSKVLAGLLPVRYAEKYNRHAPYGMFILIGLFITGFIKFLIWYPVVFVLNLLAVIGLRIF
jgi:Zn-dependent protease